VPLDYRGPGAKVLLIRRPGVRFTEDETIFRHYGVQEIPDAIDVGPMLQSLTVVMPIASAEGMYRCEVQLASHYEDSIRLLNSFVSDFGNSLRITLGYGGTADQEKFRIGPLMFFTHYPGFNYGTQTQITLKGIGVGSGELARRVRTTVWKATQLTLAQIIAGVASDHRLTVLFGRRPGEDAAPGSGQIPVRLNRRLTKDYNQDSKTDQQLIGDLCREGSCSYIIENGRLYVFDQDENREQSPVGTLVFFGQIDTARNKWPITGFQLEGSMWFRPGGADSYQVRSGIDPRTGLRIQVLDKDPSQEDVSHDGDDVVAGAEFLQQNNSQAFNDPGAKNAKFQASYAQQFFNTQTTGETVPRGAENPMPGQDEQVSRDNAQGAGYVATCDTPGNPLLRAGQIVRVEGGGRFSGNYLINRVEHKFDGNNFTTSLKLFRNSTGDQPSRVTSGTSAQVPSEGATAKRVTPARDPSTDGGGLRTATTTTVRPWGPSGSGGTRPFGSAGGGANPF